MSRLSALPPPRIARRTLVDSGDILVEALRCEGLGPEGTDAVYSPDRQILLVVRGGFRWHVGRELRFVDPNHVLFVRDGEVSRDSHPTASDVTGVLFTPSPALARSLWGPSGRGGDPFLRRTALASNRLQLTFGGFVAALAGPAGVEPLVAEEWAIRVLGLATRCAVADPPGPGAEAAVRLATRAKELLSTSGTPLRLPAIARGLSVSPAYLTDAFRRVEGLPIVRYQLKLRLARALVELPHADDLTALALELGFSSHSHFSTAFRAAMGMTPSHYRRCARRGDRIPAETKRGGAERS